jgi:hypothetical protein
MARQKVLMQPTVALLVTAQAATDIVPVGNNRSGVVFVECYGFSGTGVTLGIQTTADMVNQSQWSTSQWITVTTFTINAVGSFKLPITDLGDAIRWNCTALGGGAATVKIIAFFSDQT